MSETLTFDAPRPRWLDPPSGPCANCNSRPATLWWIGDGGALAASRGYSVPWCKLCVLRAQLAHAEERAAAIPQLKAEIAAEESAPIAEPRR